MLTPTKGGIEGGCERETPTLLLSRSIDKQIIFKETMREWWNSGLKSFTEDFIRVNYIHDH